MDVKTYHHLPKAIVCSSSAPTLQLCQAARSQDIVLKGPGNTELIHQGIPTMPGLPCTATVLWSRHPMGLPSSNTAVPAVPAFWQHVGWPWQSCSPGAVSPGIAPACAAPPAAPPAMGFWRKRGWEASAPHQPAAASCLPSPHPQLSVTCCHHCQHRRHCPQGSF